MLTLFLSYSSALAASLVLEVPSDVAVDLPGVHVLGVGHRQLPATDAHPGIADEAGLSGELPELDERVVDELLERAAERLAGSRRFDVVELGAVPTPDRRGWLAQPLLPTDVSALCAANEVEGLVLLDGFDHSIVEQEDDGPQTEVRTAWRVYRCGDGFSSFVTSNRSDDDLSEALVRDTGLAKTDAVVDRLAPTFTTVARTWFPGGSARLKAAGKLVRSGDWGPAIAAWRAIFDDGSEKERGRAAFDLAVAAERSGDVDLALRWAELAAPFLPESVSAPYIEELRARGAAPAKPSRGETPTLALPEGER